MIPKPPYLGAAYYPEDWNDDQLDIDIGKMREMGINCVRVAEFAWHRMEPREGEFDFSYFRKVVDKLAAADVAVVLGTPTATPPAWFAEKYPGAFVETRSGRLMSHGGRRHMCSNSPEYVYHSLRAVREMAKAFQNDPAVVGWQIDNEIYAFDGCFCPNCRRGFIESLKARYKTIDALNEAWNHNIFSQWYDDFDQIPLPRDAWHNPHLELAYKTFQNDSHIRFVHEQADILHEYVRVPVGTDTMPFFGMDYRKLASKLDVMQFNHYNAPDNLYHCALWCDYLRTLKDRPFWNTETSTCWSGSAAIPHSIRPDGYCRAISWIPVALGAEANMYWLWRTHWGGHELTHGSVLDVSGAPMHIADEVREVYDGFQACADMIENQKIDAKVALSFTSLSWNMFESQPIISGLNYGDVVTRSFYKPLIDLGVRPDVADAGAPLDKYKLLISPLVPALEDQGMAERVRAFVEAGGVWVAGPLTDARRPDGTRWPDRHFGMLESLTGAKWRYDAPDSEGHIRAEWSDGAPFAGDKWFETWEGGEPLAKVTAGHKALLGLNLVSLHKVGKGHVILLGTIPSASDAQKLYRLALSLANLTPAAMEGALLVCPREDGSLTLVEHAGQSARYTLDAPMRDLLRGGIAEGRVEIEPYGVRAFGKI